MKIFILEDDYNRMEGFQEVIPLDYITWRADKDGAVKAFDPPYDLILLDHDLGNQILVDSSEANTGYQFVRYMIDNHLPCGQVVVHSWNPSGASRMVKDLEAAGWNVIQFPYGDKLLNRIKDGINKEAN